MKRRITLVLIFTLAVDPGSSWVTLSRLTSLMPPVVGASFAAAAAPTHEEPTTFAMTRAPVGPLAGAAAAVSAQSRELPALRTRTSRTYATPQGNYQTQLFLGSIHYRDARGAWQPIDDTLVSSPVLGFAEQNAANSYQLLLPSDAGGTVRVGDGL